jgi:hypothetical protein
VICINNSDLEFEKKIRALIETDVPKIDIKNQIMNTVKSKKKIKRHGIVTPRIAFIVALFVVSFASLYTAAATANLAHFEWNNLDISIFNKKESGSSESSKTRIEALLSNKNKALKIVTLDEAYESFPYKIYRPNVNKAFTLDRSVAGWIDTNLETKKEALNHFEPVIYDFFSKNNKWAIVIQSLDYSIDQKINSIYVGAWEKVIETEDALGLFIADKDENRIDLQVNKLEKNHVVKLQIVGTFSKGDLINVAKLYL